jgi:hypothetical protein
MRGLESHHEQGWVTQKGSEVMHSKQRKWAILAAIGSLSGLATLFLFRSIPIAAGSATAFILMIIVIKHLAIAAIIGSPLIGVFQSIKSSLREHCPWRPQP